MHASEPLAITVLTVGLSALVHRVTAAPLAAWFGRHVERMGECAENEVVAELPLREGHTRIDNTQERTEAA